MFETGEVIYELYDVYSQRTIRYSDDIHELKEYMKSINLADDVDWEIKIHHEIPDSHYPSKAERVKMNREKLINGLLND